MDFIKIEVCFNTIYYTYRLYQYGSIYYHPSQSKNRIATCKHFKYISFCKKIFQFKIL